ncbi:MCE family protein [Nocardioides immobilis]|uniref:MCE family protein n=1 Tax=Nocardioides immobilis TaxID=2049295 RepID=A0A417XZ84_9ACTN|nr:MCE family protein [Nocardioides immobilis]RHW25679.1 MCE family protein [Nocardioides immobilis]
MQIKMFRERNKLPLGLIVITWLVASILLVLNVSTVLGLFGRHHETVLPEAAGLKAGDPVRVSGLKVGRVDSVELADEGVTVEFTLTEAGVELGDETTASVSVDTVLGDKALELVSFGDGTLAEGAVIPVERTSVPYDVTEALSDLETETSRIDVKLVAKALGQVSTTLEGATPEIRQALRGVSRISATINGRDEALRQLLGRADQFSAILAERSDDMTEVISQGNLLFAELVERREDISALLSNLSSMSQQLSGFVADNRRTLGPAVDALNTVIETLQQNKDNLSKTLSGMAVYATGLGEVVSSGEFFTAYLQNLLPGNMLQPSIDVFDVLPRVSTPDRTPGGQR